MSRFIPVLSAVLPLVAGHGFILDPPARQPGDAYTAACGQQPFFQQSADINGNVQGILQVVGTDFDAAACNVWLCKGFQFDDNQDNVQSFSAGQTIDFDINIAAPHTGIANVSVVKTSTNAMIGTPLIEFDNYAANAGVAANNTAFSVTMPEDLGGDCTTPGDCVLQWFWDAPDIDQTYEACVDFVVGGGSGGGNSPAPTTTAAPAPSSSASETPEPTFVPVTPTSEPSTPEPADPEPADPEDDDCEEYDDGDDYEEGDDEEEEEEGDDDLEDDCGESGDAGEGDDEYEDPDDEYEEGDDCEEEGGDEEEEEGGEGDEVDDCEEYDGEYDY